MAEAEASGQTVRAMNRDVEQLKTDNRGMIQLMNGMEKQLSEFAAREEQTDRLAHESKEMAERAVLERDQATATEAYLRQELAVRVCVFVCLFVCLFLFYFFGQPKTKIKKINGVVGSLVHRENNNSAVLVTYFSLFYFTNERMNESSGSATCV
jgi:hypothetical protein